MAIGYGLCGCCACLTGPSLEAYLDGLLEYGVFSLGIAHELQGIGVREQGGQPLVGICILTANHRANGAREYIG